MASIGNLSLTDWIPGHNGGVDRSQPTPNPGMQWIGDRQLPSGFTLNDAGGGWYDIMDGSQRYGVLQPGGNNGRVNRDSSYIRPLQAQQAQQLRQPPPGPAPAPTQLGNPSAAPRQYAPNGWGAPAPTMAPQSIPATPNGEVSGTGLSPMFANAGSPTKQSQLAKLLRRSVI